MFPVGEKIPIAVVCYGFGKGLFQNYCQWCVWKGIFSFPVVVDQGLYYVQETGRCRCIVVDNSVLQSNAGSGNNDRQFHPFGTVHLPQNTGDKISKRLADAYACFAQGNFLII